MAKYHIIADDSTTAGSELVKTAQRLAQSSEAAVQVSECSEPLTSPAKAIDEGLKPILTGAKEETSPDKAAEELKKTNSPQKFRQLVDCLRQLNQAQIELAEITHEVEQVRQSRYEGPKNRD